MNRTGVGGARGPSHLSGKSDAVVPSGGLCTSPICDRIHRTRRDASVSGSRSTIPQPPTTRPRTHKARGRRQSPCLSRRNRYLDPRSHWFAPGRSLALVLPLPIRLLRLCLLKASFRARAWPPRPQPRRYCHRCTPRPTGLCVACLMSLAPIRILPHDHRIRPVLS
ncbi:hypothetical protein GY45DRAFT_613954 [Cubamyces sp. BRFM 1775]|nr:hypothetical protein GY45DRAFT_613954 [Cubamyces sp. BRFM 1775]